MVFYFVSCYLVAFFIRFFMILISFILFLSDKLLLHVSPEGVVFRFFLKIKYRGRGCVCYKFTTFGRCLQFVLFLVYPLYSFS